MKICPRCKKESGLESTDHRSYCNQCWSDYQKEYNKKPKRKKQIAISSKNRRTNSRQHIIFKKSNPCLDCGKSYPWYVMDFDHVRGKKRFNISVSKGFSIKKIDEEIAKCDLICANCHRVRTFQRAAGPTYTTCGYEPQDRG